MEIEILIQQDKDGSNQQFKIGSTEDQKFNDGILVLEASKETKRSYIFKTNSLLVNAGTTVDEKFFAIKEIRDYGYNQGILDYFSLHKVECSTQLETKASNKEELLRGISESNCCKGRWNPIDRVSDELPNRVDTLEDQ